MPDLREQLERCLQGRVCLMGLGNLEYGDDGFGVRLAERLRVVFEGPGAQVIAAGNAPERFLGRCVEGNYDHVLFFDAVDFGGIPGAVVFLNSSQTASRFPQVSTHKISLGLLAKWVESNGKTKGWLLGVQPESLAPSRRFSEAVRQTFELLARLFDQVALEKNAC
jgi:hydrogenase maturation protease